MLRRWETPGKEADGGTCRHVLRGHESLPAARAVVEDVDAGCTAQGGIGPGERGGRRAEGAHTWVADGGTRSCVLAHEGGGCERSSSMARGQAERAREAQWTGALCIQYGQTYMRQGVGHLPITHTHTNWPACLPACLPVVNVWCMQEFFREHDPTQRCKAQYKSAVWYHSDEQRQAVERAIAGLKAKYGLRQIATTVDPAGDWYDAEEYHQKCEWRCGRLIVRRWGNKVINARWW